MPRLLLVFCRHLEHQLQRQMVLTLAPVSLQFQSHVMKVNESESATANVFSAKQRSTSRRNAGKIAHSMSEAQRQAKMREIGSHIAAATTVSPEQQQAAVKAAMAHAWRGVSASHGLSPGCSHNDVFCPIPSSVTMAGLEGCAKIPLHRDHHASCQEWTYSYSLPTGSCDDVCRDDALQYSTYAWGMDELQPVSKRGKNSFAGMGATIVDSLSTLWIMGMKEEFANATEWVQRELKFPLTQVCCVPHAMCRCQATELCQAPCPSGKRDHSAPANSLYRYP